MLRKMNRPESIVRVDSPAARPRAGRIGVLIVNLGTPDATDAGSVRRYLREFLSDARVIENQGLVWKFVLNAIILPRRPRVYFEEWDEPRLLKFGVTANPAPLNELSPYGNIQPPHLHGYFVSKQGQFLLTALPGGRTRLEGTTWYQHTMWPAAYWHLWSDYIIHKIHLRVLEHIRAEAERN
jgi:hypothetical protein